MNDNIALTIDEIHAIRAEHSERTKNLPYDEYHILLEEEAAPVRLALERAKAKVKQSSSI
ncbi:MAG: hypothetical protein HFH68_05305 [Lachnospiraceae bacterium]|nr:hypothetical protein [Lachnospiraceae bacterium]